MKKNFANFIARTLVVCSVLLLASNAYADVYIVGNFLSNWNNFVPMSAGANNVYSYSPVVANSEFKFTTQPGWNNQYSGSENLFDQSNPDNGQNEGVSISKSNNNLTVNLANGYGAPITFYVSTSNKTYWAKATKNGGTTTQNIYIPGDFNGWNQTGNQVDANGNAVISLAKNTYKFKIKVGDQWYGNGGTMTRTNCTDWGFDGNAGDAQITADVPGDYIFKVTMSGGVPRLTVTFPPDASIVVKASKNYRYDSDVDDIVLTATPNKGSYTNYEWQYSLDKSSWTTLTTTTTPTYTLSGANLPKQTMYYRVVGKGTLTIKSLPIIINVLKGCGENTEMKEVFSMDFGTFANVKDRRDIDNATMAAGYTFRANPKKITDGHYAVVATPYYTGCGESEGTQGAQYTDKEGDVSEGCLKEKAWYRQYLSDNTTFMYDRDYINGVSKSGVYGGMLMINFLNSIQEPVFVREIKEEEKEHFVNGAVMRFSAWVASAAQPDASASNQTTINMTLMIQYYDAANKKWVDASKLTTQVDYADDWVYASTELEIPDRDYTYRVIVTNANASGTGNDVLIDDVMLTVCKPKINVEFDHPKDKEDHTLANTSEKLNVLVPNTESGNFGSITDPCIMLFEELTDDAGKVSYQFVDNLVLSADGKNYVTEHPVPVNRLFKDKGENLETKPLNLRAVITQREAGTTTQAEWCNTTIKNKVEDAADMTAKPGTDNPFIIFSDNVIVARIQCGSAEISDIDGDDTIEVCELPADSQDRITLPEITFTPKQTIGTEIRYQITIKDESGTELIATDPVAWTEGTNVDISDVYNWETGVYTVEFSVQEFDDAVNPNKPVCSYPATGKVTIKIIQLPDVKTQITATENGEVEVCDAVSHEIKVTASDNVKAYQWQSGTLHTNEFGAGYVDWADIDGATKATYTIPADAPTDTYYRVQVMNRLQCATASDSVKLVRKYCDNLEFKQELDVEGVCLNDVVTYTLWVKNRAAGNAKNVAVSLADIDANLAFDMEESEIPEEYDPATQTWTIKDELKSQEERSISLRFKVVSEPDDRQQPIVIKSFISSLNEGTYGEYDRQLDETLKGEDSVVMNQKAKAPTPKRTDLGNDATGKPIKDEYFAYNMCPIDTLDKVIFDKLIKGDGVGENYIWLDANKKEIAKEDAWFDPKVPVKDETRYVFNVKEGFCNSDTVEVHYRVKQKTPVPVTNPYVACATETSTMINLKDRITNADVYKEGYLIITDKDDNPVSEFDASKVTDGKVTYNVTASLDEIDSDDINSCESTATITVWVKDYVKPDQLNLTVGVQLNGKDKKKEDVVSDKETNHVDIAVCDGETPTIKLTTGKDSANQGGSNGTTGDNSNDGYSNLTYTWYNAEGDSIYSGSSVDFKPIIEDGATYKVVASSDKLCAAEVQTITFHIKPAISEVTLTPATGEVVIGGDDKKLLTIIPAEAEYTAVWHANGKEIEVEENGNIQTTISKPYIDTKYEVTVSDDCNNSVTREATTTVVWPTVFTPYVLDGLNDTFVQNMNPNFHTLICNRFGMPLVETDNGWDGKLSNGDLAVPGVYYYVVTLPDGNVKKGTIEVYKK